MKTAAEFIEVTRELRMKLIDVLGNADNLAQHDVDFLKRESSYMKQNLTLATAKVIEAHRLLVEIESIYMKA